MCGRNIGEPLDRPGLNLAQRLPEVVLGSHMAPQPALLSRGQFESRHRLRCLPSFGGRALLRRRLARGGLLRGSPLLPPLQLLAEQPLGLPEERRIHVGKDAVQIERDTQRQRRILSRLAAAFLSLPRKSRGRVWSYHGAPGSRAGEKAIMLKPNPYRALVAGLAGIAMAAATLHSQDSGGGLAGREWSAVSGDLGNTRYSTLTQINKDTLAKLRGAWTSARFDDGGGGRAMPVVKDGLVFITAGSYVYAYDARSGATVWKHQTGASPPSPGLTDFTRPEQGLPAREGVAVGDGLVFVGLSNAHVIALREKTGEQVWDVYGGIDPPRPGQGVSGAPVYARGLVFVGTSADPGFRGKVVAVDAKTGRKAWEWFAVPGPADPGHDTWPKDNDSWKIGGGAMWLVGAADPELGLVYFGTGNGVPQYAGDLRAGDNLYLCSLVALDIKTGKLKWHYQTIRHDIWEADIAQSPVVYDAQIAGRTRKLVAAMRTDGVLFVLDRETGKPVQQIEERRFRRIRARTPLRRSPIRSARIACCRTAMNGAKRRSRRVSSSGASSHRRRSRCRTC